MKNKFVLAISLLVFITFPCNTYAGNFVTLNELLSINIPGAFPDTLSRGKLEGYKAYWNAFFYEALSMKDPSVKNKELSGNELEKYYDAFQEKWLKQLGCNKIKDVQPFFLDGFIGRHVYFEALNSAKLPQSWHTEFILLEKTVFVFSINSAKGKSQELKEKQDEYFNTLCFATDVEFVKQDLNEKRQREKNNQAIRKKSEEERDLIQTQREMSKSYRIGARLRWIFIVTVLSILFTAGAVGIFFLIRYFYKKYD
jgi:hypothetical protein